MKLPNKFSALLKLAVKDAQKIEKLKKYKDKYKLDMQYWYQIDAGVCSVCMAGAVMTCEDKDIENKIDIWGGVSTCDYPPSTETKLEYINHMRLGALPYREDYRPDISEEYTNIISETYNYELARAEWKTYLKAARYLESKGL